MILLILLLMVVGSAGILFGLAYSERGTGFLAGQARRWTGDLVSWQSLEGSLSGPLMLEGLSVKQPGLALELRTLSFDWEPGALLRGMLRVTALEAEGIRVALSTTDSPPAGKPFNPAGLRLPIDILLQGVKLQRLQLTQDGQTAAVIDQIDLDVRLHSNELLLQQLDVALPQGRLGLSGGVALETQMPLQLLAAWELKLAPPGAATQAGAAAADVAVSGELAVQGNIGWSEAITFDLDYQVSGDGLGELNPQLPRQLAATGRLYGEQRGDNLSLERASLALEDTPLELILLGRLSPISGTEPGVDATLKWSGLQWPLTGENPDVASTDGSLQITGTTSAYDLDLWATLGGKDIPASQWQGRASGDAGHITLRQLQGRVLGGELRITGPLEWAPVPRWDLQLEGRDLDPSQLVPDLSGQFAVAMRSSGQLHPDRGILADVELERLSGKLLDRQLSLTARAQIEAETLEIHTLELASGGNQLNASGSASPNSLAMQWQINAPEPGAFIPGAAGTLTARGTIEGSPPAPRLQAHLEGKSLRLDTMTIPTLVAVVEAGPEPGDKLKLELVTGPVMDGDRSLLESLQLRADGTTSRHTLTAELATATEKLQTRMEGGLAPGLASWSGKLTRLDAQGDLFGGWHLEQPGALTLAAGEIALGNSCLRSDTGPARLCARLDWAQSAGARLNAALQALPMQTLVADISGELAADIDASLAADGALLANASLNITPGQIRVALDDKVKQLDHGGGDLTLTIGAGGLAAKLRFATPEQGQVLADLQLPAFTTLPLPQRQPLTGRIQASLPDLGGVAAWVPQLASSAGRLEADLRAAGTLDQPEVTGEMTLTGGAADIPLAGLQLSNVELSATSSQERPGELDLSGSLSSGPGRVDLWGQLDLPGNKLALALKGERLQVYNTRDARALLSPDLQIGWNDNTLKLRGQLLIPEAAITPQLALSPATLDENPGAGESPGQVIAPSPDVVVINASPERPGEDAIPVAPFRIDSKVRLIVGDQVTVNALGFVSSINGTVTFRNAPDRTELLPIANGVLSLEHGTFRAFGNDLDIETGQLIFADAPVTEPELNVRAVRWIDNDPLVTAAGILVTGPVTEPTLELFSRPQLEASEIQSYLLTGRSSGDDSNVLNVGTYLRPRLYVGYGYNLLEATSQFNSLFSITPRYGVGTSLGEADNNINLTITYEH
jgi:translocation and assembly module TamB